MWMLLVAVAAAVAYSLFEYFTFGPWNEAILDAIQYKP